MFRLPLDIDAGFFYWFQSGQVYTREVNFRGVRSNGRSITVFGEPRGSRRLPNQSNVDLRAEKIFRVNDFSIAAGIDVFNLFNAATPTRVVREDDPFSGELDFERIRRLRFPRNIRLGFRIIF